MPISIKQMTLNTTVSKETDQPTTKNAEKSGPMSTNDREKIIEECIKRVMDRIQYELKP